MHMPPGPDAITAVLALKTFNETLGVENSLPGEQLQPLLLAQFGPGDWHVETWNTEPVRYREQLGAVLRYTAKVRHVATGKREQKRFYIKVYRDERGEQTYRVLRALWKVSDTEEDFAVGRPVAYLSDLRALVLEEAPGLSLEEILLQNRNVARATRRVASALAAFNRSDAPTTRRHLLADQAADLERAGRILDWSCPHLSARVQSIAEAVIAGLEEVPLGSTHRDLKPDHLFLDGDRTVFIDLDSFAKADPVLDPALLLARLAAMPAQFPVPRLRARTAAQTFAEEYFAHVPRAWRSRLPVHYAGALLEVASGFFRRQEPGWFDKIPPLVEEAEDSLMGKVW